VNIDSSLVKPRANSMRKDASSRKFHLFPSEKVGFGTNLLQFSFVVFVSLDCS